MNQTEHNRFCFFDFFGSPWQLEILKRFVFEEFLTKKNELLSKFFSTCLYIMIVKVIHKILFEFFHSEYKRQVIEIEIFGKIFILMSGLYFTTWKVE